MMTTDKIREAFAACRKLIPNPEAQPIRHGTDSEHLVFMCVEGASYAETRREKAMRWLGFVQGALWVGGDADIETLKDMNRPDDRALSMPSQEDAAKGIDDHALAGMLEYLANAIDRGASPFVYADLSSNVREARNRARWLRERAEAGPGSGAEPLAEAVRKLLASRWVQATVSALSNMGMGSQFGRTELAVQNAIFVELRDALKAYDSLNKS